MLKFIGELLLFVALGVAMPTQAQGLMPKPHAPDRAPDMSAEPVPVVNNPAPHPDKNIGMAFSIFAERLHIVENCKGVFAPCKSKIKDALAGKKARFDFSDYGYLFENGKLVLIDADTHDFVAFMAEAVAAYGKPDAVSTDVLSNAFGASFEVGRAKWTLPSGVVVSAFEYIGTAAGLSRITHMTICTPEKAAELDAVTASKHLL